ncbi:MAG: S8 family serine peptidase [Bryobacteraceae bacterium]|jgi:subtilisin family serine protease
MLTSEVIIDTEAKYRNVNRVWELGHHGQGQIVALIDTGVHAGELPPGALHSEVDLTGDNDNHDYNGHGTTMATFILGMAPKARIASVKTIGKSSTNSRDALVQAFDFCANLSPRPKFINASVACRRSFLWSRNCTLQNPCKLCSRVNELWQDGIATVAAAGNFSSRPDSLTCPAAARWAVKCRFLEHREKTFWRRLAKELWPSLYFGPNVARLLGTSQAAALHAGCLVLLASAFPQVSAAGIVAVVQTTGVSLNAPRSVAVPDLFRPEDPSSTATSNIYRAYVFLKQATTRPASMDHEKSLEITRIAARQLQGTCRPSEIMALAEQALAFDESNYLAYFFYSVVLDQIGATDKAKEMLDKCNELVPDAEALTNLEIFGGKGGGGYNVREG